MLAVVEASCWNVIVVTFVPARIGFARTFCLIVAGKAPGPSLGVGSVVKLILAPVL